MSYYGYDPFNPLPPMYRPLPIAPDGSLVVAPQQAQPEEPGLGDMVDAGMDLAELLGIGGGAASAIPGMAGITTAGAGSMAALPGVALGAGEQLVTGGLAGIIPGTNASLLPGMAGATGVGGAGAGGAAAAGSSAAATGGSSIGGAIGQAAIPLALLTAPLWAPAVGEKVNEGLRGGLESIGLLSKRRPAAPMLRDDSEFLSRTAPGIASELGFDDYSQQQAEDLALELEDQGLLGRFGYGVRGEGGLRASDDSTARVNLGFLNRGVTTAENAPGSEFSEAIGRIRQRGLDAVREGDFNSFLNLRTESPAYNNIDRVKDNERPKHMRQAEENQARRQFDKLHEYLNSAENPRAAAREVLDNY